MNYIEIATNEGRNNMTVIFSYYSEKDGVIVNREGFPYEIKNEVLYYYDFLKSGLRTIKLSNIHGIKATGKKNPGTPFPCSM